MKKLCLAWLVLSINYVFCQTVAESRCNHFGKGMNLSNWLEAKWQTSWPTTDGYTFADLQKMKQAGIQSLRLPVSFALVTDTVAPYLVDTNHLLFARVDTVISWCNSLHMNLIIDNHHNWDIVNQNWRTQIDRFAHLWSILAQRYKNLDPNRFTFELLNEPAFGIQIDSLFTVFNHAIDSIRQHTTAHSIIIGPNFSSIGSSFANVIPLADTNLIYTWHCYDPYQFTHQGFSWGNPYMPPGQTFPGTFDVMLYNSWSTLINWRNTYHKPVFLGELGVGNFADDVSRCNWMQTMGSKIDSFSMPWFYWDWQYDFSMFKSNTISQDSVIYCFKHALHLYGDTLTGIYEQNAELLALSVFPNPASPATGCNIELTSSENAIVEVWDITGKKIYQSIFNKKYNLPAGQWQKGLYLLVVKTGDKIARKKLLLQ